MVNPSAPPVRCQERVHSVRVTVVQTAVADEACGTSKMQLLLANLVAGAVGGSAAAALTQPLDVVKTRAQLGHHGRSTSVLQVSLNLPLVVPSTCTIPSTLSPGDCTSCQQSHSDV